jgi:hypothetical protein
MKGYAPVGTERELSRVGYIERELTQVEVNYENMG